MERITFHFFGSPLHSLKDYPGKQFISKFLVQLRKNIFSPIMKKNPLRLHKTV
jgi:hypothetical protein